jgi:hypothetical protein
VISGKRSRSPTQLREWGWQTGVRRAMQQRIQLGYDNLPIALENQRLALELSEFCVGDPELLDSRD